MPIKQLEDKTFQAWRVYHDEKGQEVVFSGYGATRGDCLNSLDAAIATGRKAFPGIKSPEYVPEFEAAKWEYKEPQGDELPCITLLTWPNGHQTRRSMDFNDRDKRRSLIRRARECLMEGGRLEIISEVANA